MGRLQTGRLENLIRRWGSIKGGGSILSETLGDVFPVLDLENLPPELRFPAGISMISGGASVTGAVGKLGALGITNRPDSGMILTITKINVKTAAIQAISFGLRSFTSPVINARNMDSREAQNFNGSVAMFATTDGTGSLGNFVLDTQAGIDREVTIPHGICVLAPNSAFQVTASITNTLLRVMFFGYVRLAEPSELSF